jgi:NADH:ubiquinone oxidoreductase subunit K
MELKMTGSLKKFFWFLFPFVMVLMSIDNVFYGWELQYYGFDELEDFGRLLFILIVSACESALISALLLWIFNKIVRR